MPIGILAGNKGTKWEEGVKWIMGVGYEVCGVGYGIRGTGYGVWGMGSKVKGERIMSRPANSY